MPFAENTPLEMGAMRLGENNNTKTKEQFSNGIDRV